jgi:GT2 family glycosyltransferase
MTDVVLGMPVFGQLELVRQALSALDAHTPVGVELIVIDDCGPQRLDDRSVAQCLPSGRAWRLLRHDANRGFVGSVNHLFDLAGQRDVVVVNSDVTVLPGWFQALAAAASSERVASASSMADNGGILSVPALAEQLTAAQLEDLRNQLETAAPIPVAVAHCTWFSRGALAAIGGFDERFSPGYGEEVDWSLRAGQAGFIHRAALGSFVRHAGSASFGAHRELFTLQRRHEMLLLLRYRRRWFAIRRFARDPHTELARGKARIARYIGTVTSGSKPLTD